MTSSPSAQSVAMDALRGIIERDPSNRYALYLVAVSQEKLGRLQKALVTSGIVVL